MEGTFSSLVHPLPPPLYIPSPTPRRPPAPALLAPPTGSPEPRQRRWVHRSAPVPASPQRSGSEQ